MFKESKSLNLLSTSYIMRYVLFVAMKKCNTFVRISGKVCDVFRKVKYNRITKQWKIANILISMRKG